MIDQFMVSLPGLTITGWYSIQLVARFHGRGGTRDWRLPALEIPLRHGRPPRPFHHYRSERCLHS